MRAIVDSCESCIVDEHLRSSSTVFHGRYDDNVASGRVSLICSGRRALAAAPSPRRSVFAAGLLRVRAFPSALLVLQASDAPPSALEIVAHGDVQRAAAFAGELDLVAVHEWIEPAMVGAGREDVAG